MTIDDVPADVMLVLTTELDRLFKAAGCEPACHACHANIGLDDHFQLLSFEGTDEMLCSNCSREDLKAEHERKAEEKRLLLIQFPPRFHSGYSRPSIS